MAEQPIFGITNIPQDIKLELNNGTLTLKSGSVITYPDGTQVQTTSDGIFPTHTIDGQFVCVRHTNGAVYNFLKSLCYSGTTAPTGFSGNALWYDTTNNIIKNSADSGVTWENNWSLPVGMATSTSSVYTSIDVFNGFGYIGSSLFVLPGVEGFYPNGKSGFKNLFQTVKINNLIIRTLSARYSNNPVCFRSNAISIQRYSPTIVEKLPLIEDMSLNNIYYSKFDNKAFYTTNGTTISTFNDIYFGFITTEVSSPYKINELKIVNPFATIDFYDYAYASYKPLSQYANSQRFVDLYNNICGLFNNSKTLEDWFNIVYNLKTASGFGLDIWGAILNQGRQFSYEENGVVENIFLGGEQTIDGITYSAEYMEEMYRMVLFLRALGYITNCTLCSLNNLLQFYFANKGRVYVINYGTMEIRYVFEFYVSKLEKAIFTTDVLPKPTGVLANFEYIPLGEYFGFYVDGIADPEEQPFSPFDNKPFYS